MSGVLGIHERFPFLWDGVSSAPVKIRRAIARLIKEVLIPLTLQANRSMEFLNWGADVPFSSRSPWNYEIGLRNLWLLQGPEMLSFEYWFPHIRDCVKCDRNSSNNWRLLQLENQRVSSEFHFCQYFHAHRSVVSRPESSVTIWIALERARTAYSCQAHSRNGR